MDQLLEKLQHISVMMVINWWEMLPEPAKKMESGVDNHLNVFNALEMDV